MPAQLHDAAMDAAYEYVNDATTIRVLSAYAADATHAQVVTDTLASASMVAGTGTDYQAPADGAAGARSRRLIMNAKTGISVSASGTANHVALTLTGDTTVRLVTQCTAQALTSGNTVNIPSWQHEFAPPT